MDQMTERLATLITEMEESIQTGGVPMRILHDKLVDYFAREPLDAQLVMRELLDHSANNSHRQVWYLTDFLNAVTDFAAQDPCFKGASKPVIFAAVYQHIAAANYLEVSRLTLMAMYPDSDLLSALYGE